MCPAGISQADRGMNRLLHNTQWIGGSHVHVAVLVGMTMTLYSAATPTTPSRRGSAAPVHPASSTASACTPPK